MPSKSLSPKVWMPFFQTHRLPAGFEQALADLEKPPDTARGLLAADLLAASIKTLTPQLAGKAATAEALAALGKLVAARHKLLLRQVAAERHSASLGNSDTDREGNPAEGRKLGERLHGQLRTLQGRGPEDPPLWALVASDGRETKIYLSRKPIPAAMKTILSHGLGAFGKVRFMTGLCRWENGFFVFEMTAKISRIAVLIRQAFWSRAGWKNARVRVTEPGAAEGEESTAAEDLPTPDSSSTDTDTGTTRHYPADFQAVIERMKDLGLQIRATPHGDKAVHAQVIRLLRAFTRMVGRGKLEQMKHLEQQMVDLLAGASTPAAPARSAAAAVVERSALRLRFDRCADGLAAMLEPLSDDPDWVAAQIHTAANLYRALDRILAVDSTASLGGAAEALKALQEMEPQLQATHAKRLALTEFRWGPLLRVHQTLALTLDLPPPVEQCMTRLEQAVNRVMPATRLADVGPAEVEARIAAVSAAHDEVQQALVNDLVRQRKAEGDAALRARLCAVPALLAEMVNRPDGRRLLDALVTSVADARTDPAQEEFIGKALDIRFDARFHGELGGGAGARLYRLFAQVPDRHTRLNEFLNEVWRTSAQNEECWYNHEARPDLGLGPGHIAIQIPLTVTRPAGWRTLLPFKRPATQILDYHHVRTSRERNRFDAVVLHEIGHSVDHQTRFMAQHAAESVYGGWKRHTLEEVADLVGEGTGFFHDFPGQRRKLLQDCLRRALKPNFDFLSFQGESEAKTGLTEIDIRRDAGMVLCRWLQEHRSWREACPAEREAACIQAQGAVMQPGFARLILHDLIAENMRGRPLDALIAEQLQSVPEPGLDWPAMQAHPALRICHASPLRGQRGLWNQGDAATGYAVQGRIYLQSYSDEWYSYEAAALKIRISDYQFRAPGEWFAESYAAFFDQQLPRNHPLMPFLQAETAASP